MCSTPHQTRRLCWHVGRTWCVSETQSTERVVPVESPNFLMYMQRADAVWGPYPISNIELMLHTSLSAPSTARRHRHAPIDAIYGAPHPPPGSLLEEVHVLEEHAGARPLEPARAALV